MRSSLSRQIAATRAKVTDAKAHVDALRSEVEAGVAADEAYSTADDYFAANPGTLKEFTDAVARVDQLRGELNALHSIAFGTGSGSADGDRRGRGPVASRDAGVWGGAVVDAAFAGAGVHASLTPNGSVTVPSLTDGIVVDPIRPGSLLELIDWQSLDGTDTWSFLREIARTHAAAEVAPGARKPRSTYSVDRQNRTTATVAHLTEPIERQTLDDVTLLGQYIETVLREGVMLALEERVMFGTSANLTGVAETVGLTTVDWAGDVLRTARLGIALLERRSINLDGCAFVFSPEAWAALELTREDANDTGGFLLNGQRTLPINVAERRLWGVRVVTSPAVPHDAASAYLVDFDGSTTGRERESVRIDWSEAMYDKTFDDNAGATDFERNMVTFRGEGRYGFAVTRPAGALEIPIVEPAG